MAFGASLLFFFELIDLMKSFDISCFLLKKKISTLVILWRNSALWVWLSWRWWEFATDLSVFGGIDGYLEPTSLFLVDGRLGIILILTGFSVHPTVLTVLVLLEKLKRSLLDVDWVAIIVNWSRKSRQFWLFFKADFLMFLVQPFSEEESEKQDAWSSHDCRRKGGAS